MTHAPNLYGDGYASNPYGDGRASVRCVAYLTNKMSNNSEPAKTVCCIATMVALAVCLIIQIKKT